MISNIIIIKQRNIHELQIQTFIKKNHILQEHCVEYLCVLTIFGYMITST